MLNQNDPDDMYYLNMNGFLYMTDQEPLDSDDYCGIKFFLISYTFN